MLVIPAVDIKGGKCVRLTQGDPDKETIYSDDPVAMARQFEEVGARMIHVVDLDGAFDGYPVNKEIVIRIARAVSIPIEIGGGVRTASELEHYLEAGISRVILGTIVLEDHFQSLLEKYRDNIVVGIDARDSMVATHGWKKTSKIPALNFIKDLQTLGIKEIIYTDISSDGMLKGPNIESISTILSEIDTISLVAAGGVSSIDDIIRLSKLENDGLKGCIVGKAIYDGRVNLPEALKLFN